MEVLANSHGIQQATIKRLSSEDIEAIAIQEGMVPMFDDAIAYVDKVARHVPQVQYVGWDIAVTPDGPVVIEGNYNSGVFQLKPSVSGVRTGLRPLFKEVTGF